MAEDAIAVGVGERHDNEITGFDRANVGPDGFDDADRLVSHDTTAIGMFHRLVWPEIAAADAGAGDGDDRVGWLDKPGVGDVFDTNVAGAEHDSCAHGDLPPIFAGLGSPGDDDDFCFDVIVHNSVGLSDRGS